MGGGNECVWVSELDCERVSERESVRVGSWLSEWTRARTKRRNNEWANEQTSERGHYCWTRLLLTEWIKQRFNPTLPDSGRSRSVIWSGTAWVGRCDPPSCTHPQYTPCSSTIQYSFAPQFPPFTEQCTPCLLHSLLPIHSIIHSLFTSQSTPCLLWKSTPCLLHNLLPVYSTLYSLFTPQNSPS